MRPDAISIGAARTPIGGSKATAMAVERLT